MRLPSHFQLHVRLTYNRHAIESEPHAVNKEKRRELYSTTTSICFRLSFFDRSCGSRCWSHGVSLGLLLLLDMTVVPVRDLVVWCRSGFRLCCEAFLCRSVCSVLESPFARCVISQSSVTATAPCPAAASIRHAQSNISHPSVRSTHSSMAQSRCIATLLAMLTLLACATSATATGRLVLNSTTVSEAAGSVNIGVSSDRVETVYILASSDSATLTPTNATGGKALLAPETTSA